MPHAFRGLGLISTAPPDLSRWPLAAMAGPGRPRRKLPVPEFPSNNWNRCRQVASYNRAACPQHERDPYVPAPAWVRRGLQSGV